MIVSGYYGQCNLVNSIANNWVTQHWYIIIIPILFIMVVGGISTFFYYKNNTHNKSGDKELLLPGKNVNNMQYQEDNCCLGCCMGCFFHLFGLCCLFCVNNKSSYLKGWIVPFILSSAVIVVVILLFVGIIVTD